MDFKPANLVPVDAKDPNTGAPLSSIVSAGYLTPPQIAAAYGLPASTGYGIKIGIISFGGGFLQSDLNKSFADLQTAGLISSSLTPPTIQQKLFDGQTGTFSTSDGGASGENTVDIYCLATMAPQASITIYIGNTWTSQFNQAIADGCHIISVSWSTSESSDFLSTQFATASTNKVSILVASGDHGSAWYSGANSLSVGYPCASPQVISVGGTKLILSGNSRSSETDDNRDASFGSTWGGGGGLSTLFSLPSWQTGLHYTPITNGVTGSSTSLSVRGIPDISAPMNVYSVYYNGSIGGFGGTSLACPVMAGMLARLQQLTGVQRSSVDYNTLFYANPGAFYDITTGTNNDQITSGYAGTSGWDCVTGLGPPIGTAIYPLFRPKATFPKQNYGFRPASGSAYPRRTTGAR